MRESTRHIAVMIAVSAVLALTGCSRSATNEVSSAGVAPAQVGPPTASAVQSQIDRINSNTNLTPAEKKILLAQGQHALAKAQNGHLAPN